MAAALVAAAAVLLASRLVLGGRPYASVRERVAFCGTVYRPTDAPVRSRAQLLALPERPERLGSTAFGLVPHAVWGDPAIYVDEQKDGVCQDVVHVRLDGGFREYRREGAPEPAPEPARTRGPVLVGR